MMKCALKHVLGFVFCTLFLAVKPVFVQAQPLIADLSDHLIAISTDFTGHEVVMFGMRQGEGDIVIVVEGPFGDAIVRRKDRIGGIWVNRESVTLQNVPSFYEIATSRVLSEIASPKELKRHQIGVHHLKYKSKDLKGDELQSFVDSFIRLKQKEQFYPDVAEKVIFLGKRLFRANIDFPSNVPIGLYKVKVYLFENGKIKASQVTPLSISKIGFNAEISLFAKYRSGLYGFIAVLGAIALGWIAGLIFRRV